MEDDFVNAYGFFRMAFHDRWLFSSSAYRSNPLILPMGSLSLLGDQCPLPLIARITAELMSISMKVNG